MNEPVLKGQIPTAIAVVVAAIANFGTQFGLFTWTDGQTAAVNKLLGLIILGALAFGTWYGRRKVTPVAAPQLPAGTTVKVTDASGNLDHASTL